MSIALLSVSNKEGIVDLARALVAFGYDLVSSGGTHKVISQAGLPVLPVSEYTGSPEIHGGILAKRDDKDHNADRLRNLIDLIDVVVVNLYPFQATVAKEEVTWDEAIENIDIGGPTMVRSAAKNHAHVSILTNPKQYDDFIVALDEGRLPELRSELAAEAFQHIAEYDAAISTWMNSRKLLKVY